MKCPYCGNLENKVIDSRLSQAGEVTRRRRECEFCKKRYTTYERIEQALPMVLKRDGQRQPFDRPKIIAGLRRATVKRPVTQETIEKAVDEIEKELMDMGEREVDSRIIGEKIMQRLRDIDLVAYVRFASVYQHFENVDEFLTMLQSVGGRTGE